MRNLIITFGVCAGIVIGCGSGAQQVENPTPALQEPIDAEKIYKRKCGLCHGRDGKKMLAGASNLAISDMTIENRIDIITNGKGKMLPFKETLTEKEITAVAQFIETLRQ